MESFRQKPKGTRASIAEKAKLVAGTPVALEKIALRAPSEVPMGLVVRGTLKHAVEVGSPISFEENEAVISPVQRIEQKNGETLVHTRTSTYRVRWEPQQAADEEFELADVSMVETAKGSVYTYLPDGKTRRYKKAENRDYEPQDVLVYVPDHAWIQRRVSPDVLQKLGRNESEYTDLLLDYVRGDKNKTPYIVDRDGRKLETNAEIQGVPQAYLALTTGDTADFLIPVSHRPRLGFSTFDGRLYTDPTTGERMRERHLGNKVIRIVLKGEK